MVHRQVIKHLVSEINEVLYNNETSNEMAALIDYGEWSQTTPDFNDLIAKWKLNRNKLLIICKEAERLAELEKQYFKKPAIIDMKKMYKYGPYYWLDERWLNSVETIHCLFMLNKFQPDTID